MTTLYRQQAITTVTDVTNIRYNISEVIDLLSPTETPLLSWLGYDSLSFPCTQIKHEWGSSAHVKSRYMLEHLSIRRSQSGKILRCRQSAGNSK